MRLAKRIVCPVLKRRDPFEAARKIDEMAREHGRARETAVVPDGERLVADLVAEPTAQRRYPKSLFVPMEVDFSGHRYFVPERYDDYLTAMYGDWRTPPSESHREMHTCRAYRL